MARAMQVLHVGAGDFDGHDVGRLHVDRARGMRDLSALGFTRFITAGVLGWDASVATLDERIAVVARDVERARAEAPAG